MLLYLTTFLLGSLLTLVQLMLFLYCATAATNRLLPDQPTHLRLAAAGIGVWYLSSVLFGVLIIPGLFNRLTTTIILLVLSVITTRWIQSPRDVLNFYKTTARALSPLWCQLPRWLHVSTIAVGVIFFIRFARGIIAPPLAWDALTYHLLKSGRWVQSGRWIFDDAPYSWRIYEWFPPLGDVPFAWAMLGSHTDAWLAWLGAATLINCAIATYALSRILQLDQKLSWIAALTVTSAPACISFLTANYVDNTALAIVTLGSALLVSGVRQKSPHQLTFATLAMGLAVGIKITFLPYLLVALVLLGIYSLSQKHILTLGITLIALAPCLAWQIWLVYNGKSLFYPAPFSIAGIQIESGQPEFIKHLYNPDMEIDYAYELPISICKFLFGHGKALAAHHNLTIAFPLILLFGFMGFYKYIRQAPLRLKIVTAGIFVAGIVIFASFWGPGTSYYRAVWADNLARFFTTWYAMLVIFTLMLWNRAWPALFAMIIAINIFESYPRGWRIFDYQATFMASGQLAVIIIALWLLIRYRKKTVVVVPSVMAMLLVTAHIATVRLNTRYMFYHYPARDIYLPSGLQFLSPAVDFVLDEQSDSTIAFSMGEQAVAYKWFRYILLGHNLQNSVVYISPHDTNYTLIPPDKTTAESHTLSYPRWKLRMDKANVEYYLSITPHPPETRWALDNPTDFIIRAKDPSLKWILFETNRLK